MPPFGLVAPVSFANVATLLREFFDKLDLLVELPETAKISRSYSGTFWFQPLDKYFKDIETVFIDSYKVLTENAVNPFYGASDDSWGKPYRLLDKSAFPYQFYGDVIAYGFYTQTLFLFAGFYPFYISADKGPYYLPAWAGAVPGGPWLPLETNPALVASIIDASAFRLGTSHDRVMRNYGEYYADGGYICGSDSFSDENFAYLYKYGTSYKFPVCGYGFHPDAYKAMSYSNSYSGYVDGNQTSYSISAGCPVSVSVVLGAYDAVNNRTPVTITAGALSDPAWEPFVAKSYGVRSHTLTVDRFTSRAIVAGKNEDGSQINRMVLDVETLNDSITVSDPAFDVYGWQRKGSRWEVTIT